MEREFLTVKELCTFLGISRSTFYRNRVADGLPAYKIGKSIKYKKSDVKHLEIKEWR